MNKASESLELQGPLALCLKMGLGLVTTGAFWGRAAEGPIPSSSIY